MGTRVSSIIAEIGLDSSKLKLGSRDAISSIRDLITGLGSTVGAVGFATAAFGILIDQLNKAEQAAVESAKADAKLESVLRSTGGAAGLTSSELNALADNTAKMAGMDDELVKSGEAVLLTFTRIGKEAFPDTMKAAADMSAVLGGDLQGSIIQIGKAMNDFTGYTALKRAGVSFTEEQIKQIKNFKETNNLVGYQRLILSELEREFGGAAKAMNDAGDGAENLNTALGNLYETYGARLIPVKKSWNQTVTQAVDLMTREVQKGNEVNAALAALGKTTYSGIVYTAEGIPVTEEMIEAYTRATRMAEIGADRFDKMSASIKGVGDAADLTEEQIKEMTDKNMDAISGVQKFGNLYESSEEKLSGLLENRAELEAELQALRAGGYSEEGKNIQEVVGKIGEVDAAIQKNQAEFDKATNQIIFDYSLQMLAADGLTEKEMDGMMKWGVSVGLFSDKARQAFDSAMAKSKELSDSISNTPNKTVYVDVITRQYSEDYRNRGVEGGLLGRGYAGGADFIVPHGFEDDSYPLRVKSRERVQVTPANQVNNGADMSELLRVMKALPNAMSKAYKEAATMGAQ